MVVKLAVQMAMGLMHVRRLLPQHTRTISTSFTLLGVIMTDTVLFVYTLGFDDNGNDYVFSHVNKLGFDLRRSGEVFKGPSAEGRRGIAIYLWNGLGSVLAPPPFLPFNTHPFHL